MPTTLELSVVELLDELRSRDVTLEVNESKLRVRSRSTLSDADRLLIRENKAELLRVLGTVGPTVPDVIRHQETILAERLPTSVEIWDECGIANLVAVARQAGLCLERRPNGLMIDGPSSPTELRRLLREQGLGIMEYLGRN